MVAFIISNLTGLIRQILVAGAFGTQPDIDAFNAANRVSETIFNLVAGGALASAFIPVFAGLIAHKKSTDAWKLASAIINITLLVLILVSILAAIFAPWIVRYVLAPGFSDNPIQSRLTVALMRIMLPSAILFGISGILMGILNSHQKFFIPALTPSMYQLGMIIGLFLFSPWIGIFGLALGVLIGSAMHLILQIPSLLRLHGQYHFSMDLHNPSVRHVAILMGPRLLGVAIVQLNFWVNTRIASGQPTGSLTGLVIAFTLMLMPQAAIAQSIAIAAMPTFSAQVALDKLSDLRTTLSSSLRSVMLLSIPAAIGLILLRQPLITMLYQRGEFTEQSTQLVSWALLWYSVGLVSHSIVEILARAFYSLHDTKTPVLIGSIAMSLNILFSFTFSYIFTKIGWMPHGGLALANSVATTLEMIGLFFYMRRRLKGLEGRRMIAGAAYAGIASFVMSIVLLGWLGLTSSQPVWMSALGGILLGGLVYSAGLIVMRVGEAKIVLAELKNRLPFLT